MATTPVFLPGESQGQGSLVAAIYGVTQSQTRLKRLSSSSSSGRDGIPVELFQILKDDAVKVLHSIFQQILKTQQ